MTTVYSPANPTMTRCERKPKTFISPTRLEGSAGLLNSNKTDSNASDGVNVLTR